MSAAAAQTADYTGTEDTAVRDAVPSRGPAPEANRARPATLPFTGGELILVAASGGIALAAGTAMVAGARRRNTG